MANDTPGGDKLVLETMLAIRVVYNWPW